MPLIETKGAGSAQGFGEFTITTPKNYIEDVFSTYLYTGTGATQTITNNIDLSTKGGLVWIKGRSAATNNNLFDTAQGATKLTHSNTTAVAVTDANSLTAFNTTGFTIGSGNTVGNQVNTSAATYASWTFRKQTKFFDIVTYTGNGATTARAIPHSLGSVPGAMIVFAITNTAGDRKVYHRVLGETKQLLLQTPDQSTNASCWGNTAPTATNFYVAFNEINQNGTNYVAYIFAHDAGGFGLTGTDNVISCGSWTMGASAVTVNLGWEPQWILFKDATSGLTDWTIKDNMRGIVASGGAAAPSLYPDLADAENTNTIMNITSTGFTWNSTYGVGNTMIYIAIRRGPMKVPTSGTSVFLPYATNTSNPTITTGFTVDMFFATARAGWARQAAFVDRLRGAVQTLESSNTSAESSAISSSNLALSNSYLSSVVGAPLVSNAFARAPSFMDVVCYTGTGSATTQTHNLQAVPELIFIKSRSLGGSATYNWWSYAAPLGNGQVVSLNTTDASSATSIWNNTSPTSSVFSLAGSTLVNTSGATYVAYLFATCPGVSKVGSYSGNSSTQTINCGFTSGARFVLIKRTNNVGSWFVWDTARGMTTVTDPYLLLNSTAAETATLGAVTTVATGFAVDNSVLTGINTTGETYMYLAIA